MLIKHIELRHQKAIQEEETEVISSSGIVAVPKKKRQRYLNSF